MPTAYYFYHDVDDDDDDDDIIRINIRSNKILIKTTKQLSKQLHCRTDAFELANVLIKQLVGLGGNINIYINKTNKSNRFELRNKIRIYSISPETASLLWLFYFFIHSIYNLRKYKINFFCVTAAKK